MNYSCTSNGISTIAASKLSSRLGLSHKGSPFAGECKKPINSSDVLDFWYEQDCVSSFQVHSGTGCLLNWYLTAWLFNRHGLGVADCCEIERRIIIQRRRMKLTHVYAKKHQLSSLFFSWPGVLDHTHVERWHFKHFANLLISPRHAVNGRRSSVTWVWIYWRSYSWVLHA